MQTVLTGFQRPKRIELDQGSQSETYGSLAYSLVLKEVGCLFQTLYLVGEYLELAPCALGGGTSGALAGLVLLAVACVTARRRRRR